MMSRTRWSGMLAVCLLFSLGATYGLRAALAADDAAPACSNVPPGLLASNLQSRLTATTVAELVGATTQDTVQVDVSLEHVLSAAWNCAEWEVRLLLPSADLGIDGDGADVRTGLRRTDHANFVVEVHDITNERAGELRGRHSRESRFYSGAFEIKVFNKTGTNDDRPVSEADSVWDGQGRFHAPVAIGFRPR